MAITIDGKTYRNLQEQVDKNMEDIEAIHNAGVPNYTAGDNITITDGEISATDTTYTAGDGINISDADTVSVDMEYVNEHAAVQQVYLHTYYSHYVTEDTEGWALLKYKSTSATSMPWDDDTDLMDLNEGSGSWSIATGWYKNADDEVHMIITASVDKTNNYVWFNIEGSASSTLGGSVWASSNANATNGHKVDPQKFPRV